MKYFLLLIGFILLNSCDNEPTVEQWEVVYNDGSKEVVYVTCHLSPNCAFLKEGCLCAGGSEAAIRCGLRSISRIK